MMPSRSLGLCLFSGCLVLTGCRTGGETPGDVLRKQNLELQKQVAQLEKDTGELRAKLAELTGAGVGGTTKSAEVVDATPRVSAIEIDFLSGPTADSSAPAQSDLHRTVAVYIKPLDGRGRFLQATGTMQVEVSRLATLPALGETSKPDSPARLLASKTLAPMQLRDAYRSGFTGTYYVIDLSVPDTDLRPPGQILIRAHFSDAITGATFDASRIVGLR